MILLGGHLGLVVAATVSSPTSQFGVAGVYDSLVLARFWEPQAHPCGSFGGQGNLTLHGLWPQYSSHHTPAPKGLPGDWPQYCGKAHPSFWSKVQRVNVKVANAFMSRWSSVAPDYATGTLAQHEWEKHGTCWSADIATDPSEPGVAALQTRFFNSSLQLMAQYPTPAAIHAARAAKKGLTLAELQAAFGGADMVGLSCTSSKASGQVALSMVEMCFGRDAHGTPTKRVPCPAQTLLASSYDNGCATKAKPGEKIMVDQPCGGGPPRPSPSPSPPSPSAHQCVPNKHGPACKEDSDCTSIRHCVRCAHSGYCTEQPQTAA
eukprot:SAG25_NODE_266_length_10666_cov_14.508943_9_plen_320_part_00